MILDFATDNEINYAEKLLLPAGEEFCEYRRKIILCNESADIKACPGSGKSTVLLAKLIILANRIPLPNNKGICVLTHTNVAIDGIKRKLGQKSDILFKYPNHFGTIQSFVDKFLAIQSLIHYYKSRIVKIDTEFARHHLINSFNNLNKYHNKLHTSLWGKLIAIRSIIIKQELKVDLSLSDCEIVNLLRDLVDKKILNVKGKVYTLNVSNISISKLKSILNDSKLIEYLISKKNEIDKLISLEKEEIISRLTIDYNSSKVMDGDNTFGKFTSEHTKAFLELKESLFKRGILSYRDAYDIANKYLIDNSTLNFAFQHRFKYLFIDEMQDTDKHQIEIIDKIFERDKVIIQRFGDPHQAIYHKVKVESYWLLNNVLPILESKRFGERIAKVLRTVCIEDNSKLKPNESINSLPPHIIVFDKPIDVLPKFCELLTKLKIGEHSVWEFSKLPENKNKPIKAVGWVGDKEDREEFKYTIQSYWSKYKRDIKKTDNYSFESLKSFIRNIKSRQVKHYFQNFIEAFIYILYLSKKKFDTGTQSRQFTKTTMLTYLKDKDENLINTLRMNIARWSKHIHESGIEFNQTVLTELKNYIRNDFYNAFEIEDENVELKKFIDNEILTNITDEESKANNIYEYELNPEVKVELGTIHSIKGETHTATLLLETSYYPDRSINGFESERIMNNLIGNPYINSDISSEIRIKETLKMAYVAFSRPTHFLCMAIQENRINGHKAELEKNGWVIEDISN